MLDASVRRTGRVVIGGSPLRLFRLTAAGVDVVARIERGDDVGASVLVDRLLDAGAVHPRPAPGTGPSPDDVTVVVPVRGRCPHPPPGAIVVDDGSDPPVAGAAARLPTSRGPGAARTTGLDLVTTPFVAFVDADVVTPDGWLDALLPHFADERVALVAPRVRSAPGTSALARYEHRRSPLDLGAAPARVRAGTRVSYVPAAAVVCRVDALRDVGGFDPSLRFGEDVDLVWRLDERGWRCRYDPSVEVVHAPRSTWHEWVRQRASYGSSAAPLAVRHPGALAPVRMNGWTLAAWLLLLTGRPLAAGALTVGTAAALAHRLPDVPPARAAGLAISGTVRSGTALAAAVRRVWWPLVLPAAVVSRRARRVALAAALMGGGPRQVLDDLAYGAGVWRGVVAHRTVAPLLPVIERWPPDRSAPPVPATVPGSPRRSAR